MLLDHPAVFAPVFKEVHYFDTVHVPAHQDFQARRARRSRQIMARQIAPTIAHRAALFVLTELFRHRTARRYVAEHRFAAAMAADPIDDRWYAGLFEGARPDQVTCDFTPAYALLPDSGIAHMRRLCPDAKILYILRNPVERALSHARMLVVRNQRPRTTEHLVELLDSPVLTGQDDSLSIIDRWQAAWPEGRFEVLFFDDIARQPQHLLRQVCTGVGLDYRERYFKRAHRVVYPGPEIAVPDHVTAMLRRRHAGLLAGLRARFPAQTAAWPDPQG